MLWAIFVFNKLKRYQISDIEDIGQRYQLVYSCKVLNTSVSFRYQLKRLYDVLSWSVSLRYQFVHHHNVSNWSVLSTFQQDVAKTSLIGLPYWRTSCDVVSDDVSALSKLVNKRGQFVLDTRQYTFRHLQWFSFIKVPASTSVQRLSFI